jgi:hypothetical protein
MWVKAYVGITGQTIYNYIYIPDGNYYFDNLISYINGPESLKSPQLARTPMSIFFDLTVLIIMDKIGENHDSMWNRHSNLE